MGSYRVSDRPINVLLIEADPAISRRCAEALERSNPRAFISAVDSLSEAEQELGESGWDVVITSVDLPDRWSRSTLSSVVRSADGTPVVALVAADSDGAGLAAIRGGAEDFVVVSDLDGALLTRTISSAIRRARLSRELRGGTKRDPLTGLPDRTELGGGLRATCATARRRGDAVAAIRIDVNRLEAVNDRSGRAAGDAVLRCIADALRDHLRDGDTVARIAGDEFMIVARVGGDDDGRRLVMRLSRAVEGPAHYAGQPLPFTVSIGAAMVAATETTETILAACAEALALSRAAGTGLVRWSDSPPTQVVPRPRRPTDVSAPVLRD